MICKHCGVQIPDEAMFCGNCGTKVEPDMSQGQPPEGLDKTPPIMMTPQQGTDPVVPLVPPVVPPAPPVVPPVSPNQEVPEQPKKSLKKPLMIAGSIVALIVVIAILFTLGKAVFGQSDAPFDVDKAPLFYEEDGDLYALYPGDTKGIRLIRDFSRSGMAAVDEKTFYYLDDYELLLIDHKGKNEKIASDVMDFEVSPDGKKVLLIDEDMELHLYDGKKLNAVSDEEVYGTMFAEDSKHFVFGYAYRDGMALAVSDGKKVIEVEMNRREELNDIHALTDKSIYYSTWNTEDYATTLYRTDYKGRVDELFEFDGYSVYFDEKMSKAIYLDSDARMHYFDGKESERISRPRNISRIHTLGDNLDAFIIYDNNGDYYYYEFGMEEPLELEDSEDAYDISWTNDGAVIVMTTEDELVIYNPSKRSVKVEEIKIRDIRGIRLSADGKKALLTDYDGALHLYQVGKSNMTKIADEVGYTYRVDEKYKTVLVVDEDQDVYYFDGRKATRVGKDYRSNLTLASDAKSYFFIDDNDDLYFGKGTKTASRVAREVISLYTYNMKDIYFLDDDDVLNYYKLGDKDAKSLGIEVDRIYTMYDFLYY